MPAITSEQIRAELPEPFSPGWNRIPGLSVDGHRLVLDPAEYFFRYENPAWLLCDWQQVQAELLTTTETTVQTTEQRVLDFVRTHGHRTTDPVEVLRTAWQVYAHIFRTEHLTDPGLSWVTPTMLTALRECATLMALNRVELDGRISNVGPAWMIAAAAAVAFDFSDAEAEQLDELYHGLWFNEPRRIESVLAHAALGGRLAHGCQSRPNMSGGCVVPYGCDIDSFYRDLATFRTEWLTAVRSWRAA